VRCKACDKNLTSFESTRKIVYEDDSVEYIDLCNHCYKTIEIEEIADVVNRYDLLHEVDIESTYDDTLYSCEEGTMPAMWETGEG
jgi:hypothetical protein